MPRPQAGLWLSQAHVLASGLEGPLPGRISLLPMVLPYSEHTRSFLLVLEVTFTLRNEQVGILILK